MLFWANVYTFFVYKVLLTLCLILSFIFGCYIFSKFSYLDSGVDGVLNKIFGNSVTRTILTSFVICVMVFVSNNDVYQLFGGKDIRFLSDGRYCYNVSISRCYGNGNAYTLPASVLKETENGEKRYFIEKVYFNNGGYLVFDDEDDYVTYDNYGEFYDQNDEEWFVEITNKYSSHKNVNESKPITIFSALLTLIEIVIILLGSIEYILKLNNGINSKNAKHLLDTFLCLIDRYEDEFKPSCKEDLKAVLLTRISNEKRDIKTWKDYNTDYIKIANAQLADISFDLLSSGRYHIYVGTLNPMNCSSNLLNIYNKSMEYAELSSYITAKEKDEQYNLLMHKIKNIG